MSTTEEQYEDPKDAQQEEAELSDEELEDAAGGSGPYPFGDEDNDGTPDELEPSPTFPNNE